MSDERPLSSPHSSYRPCGHVGLRHTLSRSAVEELPQDFNLLLDGNNESKDYDPYCTWEAWEAELLDGRETQHQLIAEAVIENHVDVLEYLLARQDIEAHLQCTVVTPWSYQQIARPMIHENAKP
ncbi:hypothetical protein DSL72_005669 [Monilinia vaccinii-corymbosi]|uniref:Uncharacterized protein n=1 Tax=Monilinia vaccinii-corymbosi TaxID=61207 RepID=A0A8A3PGD5_9HELO|nr:hypothetical protein DSL72_005669 [Monilinia vaccinii-corymbosi]